MQITKEQIIEVLNGYAYQQKSCELDRFIIDADFSSVADEILTLLQSNDAVQPNGSKPDVSGSLPPVEDSYLEQINSLMWNTWGVKSADFGREQGAAIMDILNEWAISSNDP